MGRELVILVGTRLIGWGEKKVSDDRLILSHYRKISRQSFSFQSPIEGSISCVRNPKLAKTLPRHRVIY